MQRTEKLVIGITGKKRSGKDEVCEELLRLFALEGTKAERIGFADAVKEQVSRATGCSIEFMEDRKTLFRPLYQWWGTDYKRNLVGQDYWINIVKRKIQLSNADVIIIPDVRFANEAQFVLDCRGVNISVSRSQQETSYDFHVSESGVDNLYIAHFITNDGTIEQLKEKIYGLYTTQLQKML